MTFSLRDPHLVGYLSDSSSDSLQRELNQFPENMRYFLGQPLEPTLQGDVLDKRPYLVLKAGKPEFRDTRVMVISNSCDIDPENRRDLPVAVLVAPIGTLALLEERFREGGLREEAIASRMTSIRKQETSAFFYLPPGPGIEEESVVYLDGIQSLPLPLLRPPQGRLAMLSQYGFYLFLLKLSYHLCRVKENVDREAP
jgi:hypothetical protein